MIYKACEICTCEDCKTGTHREGSWYCPVWKCQICEVCCLMDMDASTMMIQGVLRDNPRKLCIKAKCKEWNNYVKRCKEWAKAYKKGLVK